MLFVTPVFTVVWFWPANITLWAAAQVAPNTMADATQVAEFVRRWVAFDWLRVAVGMAGFVCSTRALSIPFPDSTIERGN